MLSMQRTPEIKTNFVAIMKHLTIDTAVAKALNGTPLSVDEAIALDSMYSTDELCEAADRIRTARCGNDMDTCSIVNGRSGRCSEDCKWCAQSAHHSTGIEVYDIVDEAEMDKVLDAASSRGVRRFSLVTSGRKVAPRDIDCFCRLYRHCGSRSPKMHLCASMGLLSETELQKLRDAGVSRYHCNLETSASFFPTLCTTHTREDKLKTISAARKVGMTICSGGIIGMGESLRDRLEMAQEAREAGAVSIPVNILQPIKGTPLENTPLISEEEIIRTIALMRFVAPDAVIRFAGGRARISSEATRRILHGGLNGAMIGDLLTTVGNNMDSDFALFAVEGFTTA